MTGPRTVVGCLPEPVDLVLYQGDDAHIDVAVTDPTSGAPVDLTGYTALAQIRQRPDSTGVLAEFVAAIAGNVIALDLPHDQAARLTSNGCWDVQITSPTGAVATLAAGGVLVTREVTREATP